MSVGDLKDFTSAARFVRRLKDQCGATFNDEEAAVRLSKSFGDWCRFELMREQLDERRRNDPPQRKPIPLTLCD